MPGNYFSVAPIRRTSSASFLPPSLNSHPLKFRVRPPPSLFSPVPLSPLSSSSSSAVWASAGRSSLGDGGGGGGGNGREKARGGGGTEERRRGHALRPYRSRKIGRTFRRRKGFLALPPPVLLPLLLR